MTLISRKLRIGPVIKKILTKFDKPAKFYVYNFTETDRALEKQRREGQGVPIMAI